MKLKDWKRLESKLKLAAKEKDNAIRGIKIAAVISEALGLSGISPVLVGGAAVAFYTAGKYTTRDIDMVVVSCDEIGETMKALGFIRYGKDYVHNKLGVYVEFPSENLTFGERTEIIKLGDVALRIISKEDLVVDRLCAFKFWSSAIDGLNALLILEQGDFDRGRIVERARDEDVLDAFDYIEDVYEKVVRKKIPPDKASDLLDKFIRK